MVVFEREKSSTNMVNNGTMSDDEVAASDVPPRYLFLFCQPMYRRIERIKKETLVCFSSFRPRSLQGRQGKAIEKKRIFMETVNVNFFLFLSENRQDIC